MSPLMALLRATHCRSTHHYFALDALRMVQTEAGERLRSLLLHYNEKYLDGAKAPDTRFRDFHNHVIHVNQNYFGGAPRLAMTWYDRALQNLATDRGEDAAYAMGILSHYFTDPLMPLHTAQSDKESAVHRPMEWSIFKAYDRILKCWTEDDLRLVFQLGDGDAWLSEAMLKGARFANRSYERLIRDYDMAHAASHPDACLNRDSIQTLAELFGLAITGLARLIERAADDAEALRSRPLPSMNSWSTTILAVLQIPEQLWKRHCTSREEIAAIEAIIAEYQLTGTVKDNLPDEIYIKQRVMEVREREIRWSSEHAARLESKKHKPAEIVSFPTESAASTSSIKPDTAIQDSVSIKKPAVQTLEKVADALAASTTDVQQQVVASQVTNQEPVVAPESLVSEVDTGVDAAPISIPFASSAAVRAKREPSQDLSGQGMRLRRSDPLEKAPSIGSKTAAAFSTIHITTVGEFLDAEPIAVARKLKKSWIGEATVRDWQDQSLLMCQIPGLLARDTQLLVGIGCRDLHAIATYEPATLHSLLVRYANTTAGQRILRDGTPPDQASVQRWVTFCAAGVNRRMAA